MDPILTTILICIAVAFVAAAVIVGRRPAQVVLAALGLALAAVVALVTLLVTKGS
ncbi:MAG TPA: hypothetical protein VFG15_06390 [Amycolatopsis sp.]|nr:hypothetical protein [Amycolatopsis sp.]